MSLESVCESSWSNAAKNYLVDTSASWLFYTPMLAISECASGMETKEVVKSRLLAMGVHALVMRPYGKLREKWAKFWNTNSQSSALKKFVVDASISALYQIPIYSAILYASNVSFDEATYALPAGVAIGLCAGRPYGHWLDYWRKTWGLRGTLHE